MDAKRTAGPYVLRFGAWPQLAVFVSGAVLFVFHAINLPCLKPNDLTCFEIFCDKYFIIL
jgi:hypothetical protein